MNIKETLKEFGMKLLKNLSLRPKISHSSLIRGVLLLVILFLSIGVRLLPLRWGFYLNEFDPYFHYHTAKYISNNGLASLFSWRDYSSWYPWGREMRGSANLGITLTAVTLYRIMSLLGASTVFSPNLNPLDPLGSDPLYNVCAIFPLIMAALTCMLMYLLGSDLGGEAVGLLSALLLAIDSSYVDRTSLGWFDDETVGILSALLLILSFNRAIDARKNVKSSIIYAVIGGLSLGYLCASWGAARYLVATTTLFTLILLLLKRYTPRLLLSYAITFSLALSIAAANPRTGLSFLLEETNLPVYGVLFLLFMGEMNRRITSTRKKLTCILLPILVLIAAYITLLQARLITPIGGKFLFTLIPSLRSTSPLFESVAEHKPSSWATFYYNFGIGVIFAPVGIFFATIMATTLSIFTVIYCLTSIYFASSMIRLNILASPALCLLWALALKRILSPLILSLREETQRLGRKVRVKTFEKELIGGLLIVMFSLFALTHVFGTAFIFGIPGVGPRFLIHASSPTTISGASISAIPSSTVRDWIDTLIWMRENLPPSPSKPGENGTVVASWWDYGYWITVIANKTTLADNGTINGTQIAQIGRMFMSNETEAIRILKKYNVTHVVVYVTFFNSRYEYVQIGNNIRPNDAYEYGGDNGKWIWMALISGIERDENSARKAFGNYTLGWDYNDANGDGRIDSNEIFPNSRGQSTVLYKLMFYGRDMTLFGYSSITLEHFKVAYFSQKENSPNPAPGTSIIPLVCVYEVIYK